MRSHAWASDLYSAAMDTPHHFQGGTQFDDYLGPRKVALRRRHEQGYLPNKTALHAMLGLPEATAEGPCAFCKDSNPRNFIITTQDIVAVDTDDLSLAPLGYDLAKIVATLHLTYGPLSDQAVTTALLEYNAAARRHDARLARRTGASSTASWACTPCSPPRTSAATASSGARAPAPA
ncbi:hypothetical protein [Streptomyces microflavus]|uniref:hypothetical protein n=1 Tax=Streptomyces microflavus TaxID=1919 RepID=UPI0032467BFC